MIQITAVRTAKGESHKNIVKFQWHDLDHEDDIQESTLATMLKFIQSRPRKVIVRDGNTAVSVKVVNGTKPYIQTFEGDILTNTLLDLPRF